jgi:hypothetical protein
LAGHYQHSVYDIDYDGNLEILVADGEHSGTCHETVIWDLVDWVEDGRFLGYTGGVPRWSYYGPMLADVTGDGRMEIVQTSWDEVATGGLHIYTFDEVEGLVLLDEAFFSTWNFPNYASVQDIDDDGLVEIVVSSQGGRVWAFDTYTGKAWNHPDIGLPRPRSEVQFYSERRMGAAEYLSPPSVGAPEYTLTMVTVGSGDYTLDPDQPTYTFGAEVEVTAIPAVGWVLDHWELDGVNVGSANPYTVTMNEDHTLTVVFVEASGEIVVDDTDATFVGTWPTSTYIPGYYGDGYRYHFIGSGSNTATWEFIIPQAGFWEAFAMWSSYPNRATNAPYTINHADGPTTVRVNQETQGSQWVSLGIFNFNTGSASIILSDDANEFVIADAIKLTPL